MKAALVSIVVLLGASAIAAGGPDSPSRDAIEPLGSSEVVVRRLEQPVPVEVADDGNSTGGRGLISTFLWDTFVNKPEEAKFAGCTTENLESKSREFSAALVRKAKAQSLDAASLDSCLVRTSEYELPVGAYAAFQGELPIWIIVTRWEMTSDGTFFRLGHIRVYAFDAQTYSRVGYVSCS